jgi:hypothetical protein
MDTGSGHITPRALGVPGEYTKQAPKKDLREIVFSKEYGESLKGRSGGR